MARVEVHVLPGGKRRTIDAETVRDLLERLGGDAESYVVLRGGRPLLPGERLREGESLVVVRVLSGG